MAVSDQKTSMVFAAAQQPRAKKRGFCPSCGGRRMAETAALLADEVLPGRPLRQWVLSLPHALRFLLATNQLNATSFSA